MSETNKDQIAVVTGASRGIGAAIASRLAANGFTVGIHYGRDAKAADAMAAAIGGRGGKAFAFCADLASNTAAEDFWASFDKAAADTGVIGHPLKVLVNNAGVTLRGAIEDFSREDFLVQQAVNVNAPYFIVKEALPRIADGGRIVNISSGVTRIAFPEIIGYALTKGAIDAFTLTLAKHLGPRGITVNAVAPGVVDTDINASWLRGNQDAIDGVSASTALGRVGQPDDIASIVAFLASDDGRWVTGQTVDATGGTNL
ncbi:SDR family oxidoreductase [Arthrobacter sp. efr-133-R2A-120]|uniref:SDR family NAD(P)-dependent oxidoreductase n=1 Tax=Arthrobacter sp. efr-133-R2A-120 TaxID=3040277 RepID=UPI00254D3A5C|nr:SDR family oxidoreductase [Arthrobacter sp. efr-133-R2A-120]